MMTMRISTSMHKGEAGGITESSAKSGGRKVWKGMTEGWGESTRLSTEHTMNASTK